MRHNSVPQLVDLARGLMSGAVSQGVAAHLEEGCVECQDLAEFFTQLSGVCARMAALPVPEAVVRNARAIFPSQTATKLKRVPRIPAVLVYDSLLAPEPLGLRSAWQVGWQALYRAGDCSLDLRVEPELSSTRAALIGQISNHKIPENQMVDIAVYLRSGRSVVAETRSNRFGEFQMEYEQQGRLQLCVDLESGTKRFQVPLKRFSSEKTPGGVDWVGSAPESSSSEQNDGGR